MKIFVSFFESLFIVQKKVLKNKLFLHIDKKLSKS